MLHSGKGGQGFGGYQTERDFQTCAVNQKASPRETFQALSQVSPAASSGQWQVGGRLAALRGGGGHQSRRRRDQAAGGGRRHGGLLQEIKHRAH